MSSKYKMLEELGLDKPALPMKEYKKMSRREEWDYTRNKYPEVPRSFLAHIDYMRRGVRLTEAAWKKVQDPYYAKGPRTNFQWSHEVFTEEIGLPFTFFLNDGTNVAVEISPSDIGDPYIIDVIDDTFWVTADGEKLDEIDFSEAPTYEKEGKKTSQGVPLTYLGWLAGKGTLLLVPNSHCQYWNTGDQCLFCDMDYHTRQAMKLGKGWKVRLTGDDVYELITEALKEAGRWQYMVMCGGSTTQDGFARELRHNCELLRAIRKAGEPYGDYRVPVSLLATALPPEQMKEYKEAGADAFGVYIETWKKEHFEIVCPGKNKYIGYETSIERAIAAVDVFGEGNVVAGFTEGAEMAPPPYGFGEVDEALNSTLEGWKFLVKNKIIPASTNLCVMPGSKFYRMGVTEPPLEFFVKLDLGLYRLLMNYWKGRLSADQAGYKWQPLSSYVDYQRIL